MVFASNAMHFIIESKSTFMALKCACSLKWNQSHFLNAIIFISFINLTNFRTFSSNGKKNWFKSHSCHWSHFPLNKEHGKKQAQLLFDKRITFASISLPQKISDVCQKRDSVIHTERIWQIWFQLRELSVYGFHIMFEFCFWRFFLSLFFDSFHSVHVIRSINKRMIHTRCMDTI